MSFNRVILLGNVTRDPELKFTPKGSAVCRLGMALNHKWKTETGDMKEEVTFVDLTAWGRSAENIGQYVKRGDPLHIEGRLKMDEWTDKQSGQKKTRLQVVIESFQLIASKHASKSSEQAPATKPSGTPAPNKALSREEEDEIPF